MGQKLGVVILVCAGFLGALPACAPTRDDGGSATEHVSTGSDPTDDGPGVTSGMCPGYPPYSSPGPATSEPTGASTVGCPEHAHVDACCCFVSGFPAAGVVCGRQELCQEIVVASDVPNSAQETTACPQAIDCALAALVAGEPGTLRWRVDSHWGQEVMELHLVGDGTAYTSYLYEQDVGCAGSFVERRELRAASYFADCAGKPGALDRFACVRDPLGPGDIVEQCDAAVDCGDP